MSEEGRKRGFALLTPEQRAELSSRGGKAAHRAGTAHQWTSAEAKEMGRKGAAKNNARRRDGA
jgi:uncharacterized protein